MAATRKKPVRLGFAQVLTALERLYGPPAPPQSTEPLEMILWENVAYLLPEEKRAAAFAALRQRVGTRARDILAASSRDLHAVASLGGMRPEQRVEKLRAVAETAQGEFGGDLRPVLAWPLAKAKRALRKFPGIGEPGAEKILMCNGAPDLLALDSNGLRVLLRIGFGTEKKNYAASYRSAQEAVANELPRGTAARITAHQLLRQHGQTLCKANDPRCEACPLSGSCAHHRRHIAS